MSGNVKECPVDGQELALVVENIALREQIGGLTVSELASLSLKNAFVVLLLGLSFLCCFVLEKKKKKSNQVLLRSESILPRRTILHYSGILQVWLCSERRWRENLHRTSMHRQTYISRT